MDDPTVAQRSFCGLPVMAEQRTATFGVRPVCRLRLTAEGQVVLQLRHPWADGTTHLRFDPLELLERLASCASTLREPQGRREPSRTATLIRTIPSHVEGWR